MMSEQQPEIFKNLRQRLQEMPALSKLQGRAQEIRGRFQERQGGAGTGTGSGVLQREGVGLRKMVKEHSFQVKQNGVPDPVSRMQIPGKAMTDPVIREHAFKLTKD